MSRRRSIVPLTDDEREQLRRVVRTGKHAARTLTRAQILLLSASGEHTVASICRTLAVCPATVYNVRARYRTDGLDAALVEKPRPGFPRRVTPRAEAQITTIACSTPPEGRRRWTIQLITDRLVALYGTELSDESVRLVLKKANSSRGRSDSGASGR
ncbi:MAG: helix-turn-helix domain-containing protein [Chloroflexota bacterium]|nr:helix-turn-helix domain-containing protein [Chloroflexota bacterium]